jgi:hypothetical protein
MSKRTFLFLLAWAEGSDSAGGELTNINSQDDLLPEYQKGNEHIFALVIRSAYEEVAEKYGYAKAFHDNYTGEDSVSNLIEIFTTVANAAFVHPWPVIEIDAVI